MKTYEVVTKGKQSNMKKDSLYAKKRVTQSIQDQM
jgi:hypothetical protein